jgi:hypothetical protein
MRGSEPVPEPLLFEELSKLKEFAVFAFCAEITRLPGHCATVYARKRDCADNSITIPPCEFL